MQMYWTYLLHKR